MNEYTFKDWMNGIDEPTDPYWHIRYQNGYFLINSAKAKITEAQRQTFYEWVNIYLEWHWPSGQPEFPSNLEDTEKIYLAKEEMSRQHEIVNRFGKEKVLKGLSDQDLSFIDANSCKRIREIVANKSKNEKTIVKFDDGHAEVSNEILLIDNDHLKAHVAYKTSKLLERWIEQRSLPEDELEKLKNLPHKLCICYELGILDLLDEFFKHKNNSSRRLISDKARLLASLLEENDPEKVRLALKNQDFLSSTAVSRAINTLTTHGITPTKLIIPDKD